MEIDVDVIDDGYKWRKYGQKAVKNSPYPRYVLKERKKNVPNFQTLTLNLSEFLMLALILG